MCAKSNAAKCATHLIFPWLTNLDCCHCDVVCCFEICWQNSQNYWTQFSEQFHSNCSLFKVHKPKRGASEREIVSTSNRLHRVCALRGWSALNRKRILCEIIFKHFMISGFEWCVKRATQRERKRRRASRLSIERESEQTMEILATHYLISTMNYVHCSRWCQAA